MLVAVDEANEHIISLWDWEKNSRFSDNKVEPTLVQLPQEKIVHQSIICRLAMQLIIMQYIFNG